MKFHQKWLEISYFIRVREDATVPLDIFINAKNNLNDFYNNLNFLLFNMYILNDISNIFAAIKIFFSKFYRHVGTFVFTKVRKTVEFL